MLVARNRHRYSIKSVSSLLFLLLLWTTAAPAQTADPPQAPPSSIENSNPEEERDGRAPTESPDRSRVDAWFDRSGSGLFISLTPFATAITLLIFLLIVLSPLLIRAAYRRGTRGYFKTVHTGQRRYA